MTLSPAQNAAIKHVEDYARTVHTIGQDELDNVLAMSDISRTDYEAAGRRIKQYARIALHFHPDRISKSGDTVVQGLIATGQYKNQFETYVSNGRLDPTPTGVRQGWEDAIFGGAFSAQGSALSERPKYGALDLMLHPDGPSPRFGSCYFVLKPDVCRRSTFSYMDSHRNPTEKGSIEVFEPILAALLGECFERNFALGQHDISPSELVKHLLERLQTPPENPAGRPPARNLNHYIEAQVHGDVSLRDDVDIMVADPSFKGTSYEDDFGQLCALYNIDLRWHSGYRLAVEKVPGNFRGPAMPSLAQRVAVDGHLDAYLVGRAAAHLMIDPFSWSDRGPYEQVLQELKLLWHTVVRFGEPRDTNESTYLHARKM